MYVLCTYVWAIRGNERSRVGAERKGRRKEQGRNGKGESDECKRRKLGMKGGQKSTRKEERHDGQ